MKSLVNLYKKNFGNLDHFIELEAAKEKKPYGVAVQNPDEGEEKSKITSIGLSLLSKKEELDIELTMDVENLPQEAIPEIGLLFYTIYSQMTEFTEGAIYKDLSIPLFKGMQAVMLRRGFYQETVWLDEKNEKAKVVKIIPLYTAEAEELEEIPVDDRAYFAHQAQFNPADTQREQESVIGRAVRNTWTKIADWHKENKANTAAYLAKALKGKNKKAGEELEKKLKFKLPVDFKHSFNLIHERVFIGDFDLLPEEDILRFMKSMNEMNNEGVFEKALHKIDEHPRKKSVWWHEKWVPIGFNSGGDHLILDMSPGPTGVPGQILVHQKDQGPLVDGPHSFFEWLRNYNVALNRREYGVTKDGYVSHADDL